MTPEQITERLDEIIGNVADAWLLMYRLEQEIMRLELGSGMRNILEDIWGDMDMGFNMIALRRMENQLAGRLDKLIPAHLEDLKAEQNP